MTWVAAAIAGSAVLGSISARSAASQQADAANNAAALTQGQYEQTRADQAPWRAAGVTALNALTPLATNYTPFGQTNWTQDPGYAFRLSEGNKALNANAAARGGLISGNALKAAQSYGQQMGSQEYQNAFNRYQTERNAQLNPLQSLAGIGQTATNYTNTAGANAASTAGNYLTSGAAANAAGTVGTANAINSGLSSYLGYTSNNNLINALRQNQNPGPGMGAGYAGQYPDTTNMYTYGAP